MDSEFECKRCHETIYVSFDKEPTNYCHDCTHSVLDEVLGILNEVCDEAEGYIEIGFDLSNESDKLTELIKKARSYNIPENNSTDDIEFTG